MILGIWEHQLFGLSGLCTFTAGSRNMAARRIAQETLGAVLQEKADRYHMDPTGEGVGDTLSFQAQGK